MQEFLQQELGIPAVWLAEASAQLALYNQDAAGGCVPILQTCGHGWLCLQARGPGSNISAHGRPSEHGWLGTSWQAAASSYNQDAEGQDLPSCCGHAGFARHEGLQVGLVCMKPRPLTAGSNQLALTIEWHRNALPFLRKCYLLNGQVPMKLLGLSRNCPHSCRDTGAAAHLSSVSPASAALQALTLVWLLPCVQACSRSCWLCSSGVRRTTCCAATWRPAYSWQPRAACTAPSRGSCNSGWPSCSSSSRWQAALWAGTHGMPGPGCTSASWRPVLQTI